MKNSETKDEERKQRALDCRKIRMFIAANPGRTEKQIASATGLPVAIHLDRMLGMGIVKAQPQDRKPERWYVVPQ